MLNKPQNHIIYCLIGVAATFLVLSIVAGCDSGYRPVPEGEGIEYIGAIASDDPERANNGESDESLKPKVLGSSDILTLPAGTVIIEEQLDNARISDYFVSVAIPDEVFLRINGKSYIENHYITLDDLRYLKVLHYNYDHNIQVGEIIVSAELANEFAEILQKLFETEYEIYSMLLVEEFWTGDSMSTDDASMAANNTSAFSFRWIPLSGNLSRHAFGEAIDINPLQNPYVEYYGGVPYWDIPDSGPYINRLSGHDHMIDYDDDCFIIFSSYGYTWGGDWLFPKDYQHFEK